MSPILQLRTQAPWNLVQSSLQLIDRFPLRLRGLQFTQSRATMLNRMNGLFNTMFNDKVNLAIAISPQAITTSMNDTIAPKSTPRKRRPLTDITNIATTSRLLNPKFSLLKDKQITGSQNSNQSTPGPP